MAIFSDEQLARVLNESKEKSVAQTVSDNIDELGAKIGEGKERLKGNVKENLKKSKRKLHITKEGYTITDEETGKSTQGSLLEAEMITKDGYTFQRLSKKKTSDKDFMKANSNMIIDVDGDKYILISGPNTGSKALAGAIGGGVVGGALGTAIGGTIGGVTGEKIGGVTGAVLLGSKWADKGAKRGQKKDRKEYTSEEFHALDSEGNIVLTEADKPVLLKNGMLKVGKAILRPIKKGEESTMKFGQGIVFHGKRYVYQTADDARDAIRHPAGTAMSALGTAGGSMAGGAVGGAVGATVGGALGGAAGKIVGDAIDTTRTGTNVKKGYNKALDTEYQKLNKKKVKENFDFHSVYRSPEYNKAITEYFDLNDRETRKILLAVNEDDQTKVLVSLTSKLYDNVVERVDDIDWGEIPSTKGDITKLSNYLRLMDSLDTMKNLLLEYKQDTKPVDTIRTAISNIIDSTSIWKRAYALNVELPIVFYNSIVLSIIESTSYLISMCVQYIKLPGTDTFQATIDKSALVKTKDHMVFETLEKFNQAYDKGQVTNAMEYVIKSNSKNFMGELTVAGSALGVVAILFAIVPILREVIFLFYYNRVRISEYFDMQADMLQINAYNVEHSRSDLTNEQKKSISSKQMKIAERFRRISSHIAIEVKQSEVKATKELTKENKKYQTKEVLDELPDSASSALF